MLTDRRLQMKQSLDWKTLTYFLRDSFYCPLWSSHVEERVFQILPLWTWCPTPPFYKSLLLCPITILFTQSPHHQTPCLNWSTCPSKGLCTAQLWSTVERSCSPKEDELICQFSFRKCIVSISHAHTQQRFSRYLSRPWCRYALRPASVLSQPSSLLPLCPQLCLLRDRK